MSQPYTYQDYALLPEGFPAQLIEGFLVKEPSPTYGRSEVVMIVLAALRRVVPDDRVRPGPVDVKIDELNVYAPDVAVYEERPPPKDRHSRTPLLVVEIASPSTIDRDRDVKAPRYLAAGVKEVWLVDPASGFVEVRDRVGRGPRIESGDTPVESKVVAGFRLDPKEIAGRG
jgi:Uma2 family endonuclease